MTQFRIRPLPIGALFPTEVISFQLSVGPGALAIGRAFRTNSRALNSPFTIYHSLLIFLESGRLSDFEICNLRSAVSRIPFLSGQSFSLCDACFTGDYFCVSIPFLSGQSFSPGYITETPSFFLKASQSPSYRGSLSHSNKLDRQGRPAVSQSPSYRGSLSHACKSGVRDGVARCLNPLPIGAVFLTLIPLEKIPWSATRLNPLPIGAVFLTLPDQTS